MKFRQINVSYKLFLIPEYRTKIQKIFNQFSGFDYNSPCVLSETLPHKPNC